MQCFIHPFGLWIASNKRFDGGAERQRLGRVRRAVFEIAATKRGQECRRDFSLSCQVRRGVWLLPYHDGV
jgi:hypothetical protein